MSSLLENSIRECANALHQTADKHLLFGGALDGMKHHITCFITLIRQALYPMVYGRCHTCEDQSGNVEACLLAAGEKLYLLCQTAMDGKTTKGGKTAEEVAAMFFELLPDAAERLKEDVRAAYLGDPAAQSEEEILCAYPTFEALSVFRLAHILYTLEVPILPRMMTEYAHQRTGIDIHPGATIGKRFFIDHGTGVVIGETCIIGDDVKIYQGVTLGAKSFATDEQGHPIKGVHRHPRIGNGVVIYAGATILGGDTYIGDGAVIGGNIWLTRSVPAKAIVTNQGIRLPED